MTLLFSFAVYCFYIFSKSLVPEPCNCKALLKLVSEAKALIVVCLSKQAEPVCRRQKAVVLGIRGTTTLSDALTDAVGEATEATCGTSKSI